MVDKWHIIVSAVGWRILIVHFAQQKRTEKDDACMNSQGHFRQSKMPEKPSRHKLDSNAQLSVWFRTHKTRQIFQAFRWGALVEKSISVWIQCNQFKFGSNQAHMCSFASSQHSVIMSTCSVLCRSCSVHSMCARPKWNEKKKCHRSS